jgi:hypothetical protein
VLNVADAFRPWKGRQPLQSAIHHPLRPGAQETSK